MRNPIFYHGTTSDRLKMIRKYGLLPGRELPIESLHWPGLTSEQSWVHLTTTLASAAAYPLMGEVTQRKVVVLACRVRMPLWNPWTTPGIVDPGNPNDLLHPGPIPPRDITVVPRRQWLQDLKHEEWRASAVRV